MGNPTPVEAIAALAMSIKVAYCELTGEALTPSGTPLPRGLIELIEEICDIYGKDDLVSDVVVAIQDMQLRN